MEKRNSKLNVSIIIIAIVGLLVSFLIPMIQKIVSPPSPTAIFYNSTESVVELKAYKESVGESFGSAVCINNSGVFVTNAHVVTYQRLGQQNLFEEYSIRFADEENYHSVELVKYDVSKDIAVLRVIDTSLKIKAIDFGDSNNIDFGDKVYAIGNGSNYGLAITQGIISIPKVNIEYEDSTREVIQADITISAGNSGGALLNERGQLIGITTFRTKDNAGNVIYGLVYSIPINIVMNYVNG